MDIEVKKFIERNFNKLILIVLINIILSFLISLEIGYWIFVVNLTILIFLLTVVYFSWKRNRMAIKLLLLTLIFNPFTMQLNLSIILLYGLKSLPFAYLILYLINTDNNGHYY